MTISAYDAVAGAMWWRTYGGDVVAVNVVAYAAYVVVAVVVDAAVVVVLYYYSTNCLHYYYCYCRVPLKRMMLLLLSVLFPLLGLLKSGVVY